jgi:hypothetical protein
MAQYAKEARRRHHVALDQDHQIDEVAEPTVRLIAICPSERVPLLGPLTRPRRRRFTSMSSTAPID